MDRPGPNKLLHSFLKQLHFLYFMSFLLLSFPYSQQSQTYSICPGIFSLPLCITVASYIHAATIVNYIVCLTCSMYCSILFSTPYIIYSSSFISSPLPVSLWKNSNNFPAAEANQFEHSFTQFLWGLYQLLLCKLHGKFVVRDWRRCRNCLKIIYVCSCIRNKKWKKH